MKKLQDELLKEINDQLAGKSLYVKSGTIGIEDASVIKMPCGPLSKDKNGNNTQP